VEEEMFKIDHVNINVGDMDKSIAFYDKAFGLEELRRNAAADGSFLIVYLTDGDFVLELTWLREMDRPYNLGDNESHIGFATNDFEAAHELHKKMGIICYENTKMGVYFIEDLDGYWQEVKRAK
jgi:lactoylglutathione lyase